MQDDAEDDEPTTVRRAEQSSRRRSSSEEVLWRSSMKADPNILRIQMATLYKVEIELFA